MPEGAGGRPAPPAAGPGRLSAVRLRHDAPFPPDFRHYQLSMPPAPGVDERAVAVTIADEGDADDIALLRATAARHWWSADHGRLPVRIASPRELIDGGEQILEVPSLGLLDPSLLEEPGCPIERVDPTRPHAWVPARRLGDRPADGWVPYSLAFARPHDTRPDEPRTHPPLLAGLGAGASRRRARSAAWASLCAEDALWTWWSDPSAPPPAPLDSAGAQQDARAWGADGLSVGLGILPGGLASRVCLAVIDDGGITALGAASGIDRGGRRQACARALWQLVVARALDDPDDPLHRTAGHVLGVLSPHREDRRYLDAFGPLHRRLLDPLCHVQLLLDPRMRAEIRRRTGTVAAGPVAGAGRATGRPVRTARITQPVPPARPAGCFPRGCAWEVLLSEGSAPQGDVCVRLLVPGASTLPLGAFPPDPEVARSARRRLGRRTDGEGRAGVPPRTSLWPYPGW